MRHRKKINLLGKPADQRKALLRGLTTEVIKHGQIITTEARAKAVREEVDRMVTLAKRGDLHARRQVAAYLYGKRSGKVVIFSDKEKIDTEKYTEIKRMDKKVKVYEKTVVQHLFDDIAPKYKDRNGGYVSIIKLLPRRGDGASRAVIKFV